MEQKVEARSESFGRVVPIGVRTGLRGPYGFNASKYRGDKFNATMDAIERANRKASNELKAEDWLDDNHFCDIVIACLTVVALGIAWALWP